MQNGLGIAEDATERARRRATNGEMAFFDARAWSTRRGSIRSPPQPEAASG
jgi:hypothetical protein